MIDTERSCVRRKERTGLYVVLENPGSLAGLATGSATRGQTSAETSVVYTKW